MNINEDVLQKFITEKLNRVNLDLLRYSYNCTDSEYMVEAIIDDFVDIMGARWGRCGYTKVVFYFSEYPNIVFKIPFEGAIEFYDDYDPDESPAWNLENTYYDIFDFYNAGNITNDWDYCQKEVENYEVAVSRNLQDVFCETVHLCYNQFRPIYISEYCPDSNYYHHAMATPHSKELSEKSGYKLNGETVEYILNLKGEEYTNKLIDFLNDMEINDLHSGNYRCFENYFKFIDYSGCNE